MTFNVFFMSRAKKTIRPGTADPIQSAALAPLLTATTDPNLVDYLWVKQTCWQVVLELHHTWQRYRLVSLSFNGFTLQCATYDH
jgi:hypothetical protein